METISSTTLDPAELSPIERCNRLLDTATKYLNRLPDAGKYLADIATLQVRLQQPCVLAVAGKVKAGKSSFLNALIGMNLATVGELETTATINRFCYGVPDDPERPVKVVWDNGMETNETLAFMDSLQGHDEETLRKAKGISYLEYRIPNEMLKEITLVDTPGTDAVVGESGGAHEEVTKAFFDLRKKHKDQTVACAESADAVIYLVGAVPTTSALKFLDDFKESSTGASALNAVGVLSKVDIDTTLLERRHEQAAYIANALKEQLNTVVPVSAGLFMELEERKKGFAYWMPTIKSIPPKAFNYLMKQESTYLTDREAVLAALYKDSAAQPLPLELRTRIKGKTQWSLFRTIVTELYNAENEQEAFEHLYDMANITAVKEIIKEQFFNRSKIIRCYRVLNALLSICNKVKFQTFLKMESQSRNQQSWRDFVKAGEQINPSAARSLLDYLSQNAMSHEDIKKFEGEFLRDLVIPTEQALNDLQQYDADYQMLKLLQANKEAWSEDEYTELCKLFGLYGAFHPKDDEVWERQQYWQSRATLFIDKRKSDIAEYAANKYGKF